MPQSSGNALAFESGKIVLSTGEVEALEVNLRGSTIKVDIKDKDFIKRAIKLRGEISEMMPKARESQEHQEPKKKKKSPGPLAMLKAIAEGLCSRGITVTVLLKGDKLLTLGADAHPTFLQLITRTKAVAINRFFKLIGLVI